MPLGKAGSQRHVCNTEAYYFLKDSLSLYLCVCAGVRVRVCGGVSCHRQGRKVFFVVECKSFILAYVPCVTVWHSSLDKSSRTVGPSG